MANLEEILFNGRLHQSHHWEFDNDPRKQLRKLGHCAHPSGTSERRFFPSPQVSFFLCTCRSRKKLRGLGDRCCQANEKD
jgi:hypothetical protein